MVSSAGFELEELDCVILSLTCGDRMAKGNRET